MAAKPHWRRVEAAATRPPPGRGPPAPPPHHQARTGESGNMLRGRANSQKTPTAPLASALARALAAWDERQATRIMLTGHGRVSPDPALDVSRTVGWFTAEFPFLLMNGPIADILRHIRDIERQVGEAAARGQSYGILRRLTPPELVTDLPFARRPDVSVNYLGRIEEEFGDGFTISDRLPGVSVGALERVGLLDIEAMINGPRLAVGLRYCPAVHREATARRLCARLESELAFALSAIGAAPPSSLLQRA